MYHFGINLQVSITNPQFASAIAGVTIVHVYTLIESGTVTTVGTVGQQSGQWDNSLDSGTTVWIVGQQSGQWDNSRDSGTTVGTVGQQSG